MFMNKRVLILIIIIVLVIGGYFFWKSVSQSSEELTEGGVAIPVEVREFYISGTEYSFDPSSITVRPGETVRISFQNDGELPHNLTISALGIGTRTIAPGVVDTIEFTAPVAGTYDFFCSVSGHKESGMTGTLIVE
jgi:plastocyanin